MVDSMVGHGPAPDFGPYVPDFIIVIDDVGRRRVFSRDGEANVLEGRLAVTECASEAVKVGCWPLIFRDQDHSPQSRTEWFPVSDEKTWRPLRAQALLSSVQTLRGQPELVLRTVRAAAALVAINIEKIAREIAAMSFTGETLDQTYERRKG